MGCPARGLASVIRWHVIEAGNHRGIIRIADIDNHHAGVPPGDVEPVPEEIDFVAHDMLGRAVRVELVLGRVLLSDVLPLDVKRAGESWIPGIAVVEDYQLMSAPGLAQRRGRARVHEAVINFEPVSAPVFPGEEEAEQPGMVRIGDIVEGHTRLNGLALWRLDRIRATRVLGSNKDFSFVVDAQVVAPRAWIARDKT